MTASHKLSIAQVLVLSTAAARPDRMVLPLPPNLRAHGSAQQRLLASLLKAGLVVELTVPDDALCWRQDEDGQRFALRLTDAGMAAVDKEPEATEQTADAPPVPESVAEPAAMPAEPAGEPDALAAAKPAPSGKLGAVVAAITTEAGATLEELVALTGWLPHTTRAAITGLRKRGYTVALEEHDGRKAYRASQVG